MARQKNYKVGTHINLKKRRISAEGHAKAQTVLLTLIAGILTGLAITQ